MVTPAAVVKLSATDHGPLIIAGPDVRRRVVHSANISVELVSLYRFNINIYRCLHSCR